MQRRGAAVLAGLGGEGAGGVADDVDVPDGAHEAGLFRDGLQRDGEPRVPHEGAPHLPAAPRPRATASATAAGRLRLPSARARRGAAKTARSAPDSSTVRMHEVERPVRSGAQRESRATRIREEQ
jgi:hypothetical protein